MACGIENRELYNIKMTPHWEHFEHDADIGVRGYGKTMAEAFEQIATALTAVVTTPDQVGNLTSATIVCEAPDPELLLMDWLNELIYRMATNKILFGQFRVCIDHNRLTAKVLGEPLDRERHQPAVEIKGATFTELKLQQLNDGFMAQCIVDV